MIETGYTNLGRNKCNSIRLLILGNHIWFPHQGQVKWQIRMHKKIVGDHSSVGYVYSESQMVTSAGSVFPPLVFQ